MDLASISADRAERTYKVSLSSIRRHPGKPLISRRCRQPRTAPGRALMTQVLIPALHCYVMATCMLRIISRCHDSQAGVAVAYNAIWAQNGHKLLGTGSNQTVSDIPTRQFRRTLRYQIVRGRRLARGSIPVGAKALNQPGRLLKRVLARRTRT